MLLEKIKNSIYLIKKRYLSKNKSYKIGYRLKNKVWIHKTAKIFGNGKIYFDTNTEIKDYVIIQIYDGSLSIGKNCQLNPFTVIYGGNIKIGQNVMIAPHCMIASGNHDYIQTEKPMRFSGTLTKGDIIIGNDVWIGANSTITDGVIIGNGAVIAANSCVSSNIEDFAIYGGVPAKKIGDRKCK